MLLWVSLSVLTLVVTGTLVWPLLFRRAQPAAADDELQRRLAVFRDRRDEIAAEQRAGRLTSVQADQAHADLLRQMTEELPAEWLQGGPAQARAAQASPARGTRAGPAFLIGIVMAVALPLLAFGVYRSVGAPDVALAQLAGTLPTQADSPQAQFAALLGEVRARLRADPADGEAWAVLAEAQKLVGNHREAIEAFARAVELLPPNARLLTDYAESVALAAGGDFSGRPVELLEQALEADPNDQKAIALMGAAHYRLGDLPQARKYLRQLLAGLPPDSPEAVQISEVVGRIEHEMGLASPPVAGSGAGSAPQAEASPRPGLHGSVALAPAFAERVPQGATLFVVARATQGPRIPLAVLRAPASELPFEFELDDRNAMDPARPLSSADAIVIEARVSASGDAMRRPGDLYGSTGPLAPGSGPVSIVIDRVVAP